MLPFDGVLPKLGANVFVAPNATLIGHVEIGDDSSIWFGSVLRGDVGPITIGQRTNVQDLSVVHTTHGLSQVVLGDDVTIGHAVILHGCRVGHRCLVGMGSILLDQVEVGEDSIVGAGSLLPPRMVVPAGKLVLGRPARVVRDVRQEELVRALESARHYVETARRYA